MYKGGIVSGDTKPVLRHDLVLPHEQAAKLTEAAKSMPRNGELTAPVIRIGLRH